MRSRPSGLLAIGQILALLAEAPPSIDALTAGLTPAQLHSNPNPDEWSANDVLAHLRSCADVWGNCIATNIAEDAPTLRAVNPRTWMEKTDYLELDCQPSLRFYTAQRAELLTVLKPLPHEGWARGATVTGRERHSSGLCCPMRSG